MKVKVRLGVRKVFYEYKKKVKRMRAGWYVVEIYMREKGKRRWKKLERYVEITKTRYGWFADLHDPAQDYAIFTDYKQGYFDTLREAKEWAFRIL